MRFELIKDLLITCIIMITDMIYMPFPVMLPYLYSYIKHIDESISLSWAYSTMVFIYTGSICGNIILPKFFLIFGIKKTFILGGIIYFFDCCFFTIFAGKYTLLIFGFIGGISLNFKTLPTNFYLTNKYENGVEYLPYSYIGQSIGVIVWSIVIAVIVNPLNKNMDAVSFYNGYKEEYFDKIVSSQITPFLLINGLSGVIVITFLAMFLNVPEYLSGNFSLWWKSLGNDEDAKKELAKKLEEMNQTTNIEHCNISVSMSLNKEYNKEISILSKSLNNSKTQSLIEQQNKTDNIEEEITKELYSLKFIIFVIIIFIKNSSTTLLVNCFKIFAIKIIKNDGLASIIYCISTLADIFGRFAVSYCWKKFGFYKTHIYNFIYNITFNILFIISGYHNKTTFIIVIAFQSLAWAFGYLLGHTTMFGLFRPRKAVGLSKAFDVYYILQSLYGIVMTYYFVSRDLYQECYLIFVSFEVFFCLVFVKWYKDFGDIKSG